MALTIRKVDEGPLRFVNAIIYGSPNAGKTWFCGTANLDPRSSPSLLIDFEGGAEAASGMGLEFIRVTSAGELEDIIDFLKNDDHGYKSVTVDSLTESHISSLHGILESEKVKRSRDKSMSPFAIQQGDYGISGTRTRFAVNRFRDLPMHTFFTGLPKEDTDTVLGMIKKLNLPGKLPDEVPGAMNLMGFMALIDDPRIPEGQPARSVRALLLKGYSRVMTKVRVPPHIEIPDEIFEPTVTKLFDVLQIPYPTEEALEELIEEPLEETPKAKAKK